jgi:hypothetical protein
VSTETKASFKTSELVIYLLAVVGVLIASAVVDDNDNGVGFDAAQAWTLITWLTIGYLVSRGLAKSGSREFYDDTYDRDHDTTSTSTARRVPTETTTAPGTPGVPPGTGRQL